jgi:acyl-CoA thioester hydrolase
VILKTFLRGDPTIKPQARHEGLSVVQRTTDDGRRTLILAGRGRWTLSVVVCRLSSVPGRIVHNQPSRAGAGINACSAGQIAHVTQETQSPTQDYRFWIHQGVRFRDLDTLKHVNHTVYFIYAEMARLEYYREVLKLDLMTELAFLMLDIRCHYAFAAEYGDLLRVGFRIDWLKRSSSGFSFVILGPDERFFAQGEGIQVYVDLDTRRPRPIPEAMRTRILAFDPNAKDMQ